MPNPLACSRDNEQEIAVARQLITHYCKVEPTASDKHREDALGRWRPAFAGNRGGIPGGRVLRRAPPAKPVGRAHRHLAIGSGQHPGRCVGEHSEARPYGTTVLVPSFRVAVPLQVCYARAPASKDKHLIEGGISGLSVPYDEMSSVAL